MKNAQPNLFTRPDTFFGVCEGLGEDLGIHPNLLRVALAGIMFWTPYIALGAYAAAGAIVLASRLLAPAPRTAGAPVLLSAAGEHSSEQTPEPLPLAA